VRPLGDDAFVRRMEGATARTLARRKPGPKPGNAVADDAEVRLL
jgi:hypothetical protein